MAGFGNISIIPLLLNSFTVIFKMEKLSIAFSIMNFHFCHHFCHLKLFLFMTDWSGQYATDSVGLRIWLIVLFLCSSESNTGWNSLLKEFGNNYKWWRKHFCPPQTLPTKHLFSYIRYCTKTISKGKRASHEMRVGVPESWEKPLCGFGQGENQPFVHYVFNHYLRLIPHEFTFVMRQYTVWIKMWAVQ